MNKRNSALALLIAFLGAIFLPSSGQSDTDTLVIITHKSVSVGHMTTAEIRRLFLKERMDWKSGERAFPINGKPGTKARMLFQEKVLSMSDNDETIYWQNQKIKRGLTPPPEFTNTQRAVFSLKGSISYCLKSEHKPGTSKIILTL